jgi:hypothetical protein
MNVKRRALLSELLAKPEVVDQQSLQARCCTRVLENAGIQPVGSPTVDLLDTGVGLVRRQSLRLLDPSSGAHLELLIQVLAKIDGTVKTWMELWGEPATPVPERTVQFNGATLVAPSRIRMVRQELFDGSVGTRWSQRSQPVEAAQASLSAQGFFQAVLGAHTYQLEMAVSV